MLGVPGSFFRSHLGVLGAAWGAGMLLLAYYMLTPGRDHTMALGIMLGLAFVCSPFTLKTHDGRLWWLSFTLALGLGTAAVLLGGHNPAGWLLATVAAGFYAVGVCLRWRRTPRPPA